MPIIDFHCHIYPRSIAEHAARAVSGFYQVDKSPVPVPNLVGTPEILLRESSAAGIDYHVIHSVATVPHQVGSVNGFLFRVAEASEGKLIPFGTLHPDSPNLAGDLEHLLSLGMKGIKLHPDMQGFAIDEPKSIRLLETCGSRLPILFHTGDSRYRFSNPPQLIPVLERFPETTFIAAHMGGYTIWQEATRALAGKYSNLYVDISSTMFALPPEVCRELVYAYGTDRVLFGTDFPMWRPKEELERFHALGLTDREERQILFENAAGILKLSHTIG